MRLPTGTALLWIGAAIAGGGGLLLATGAWVNLPMAAVVLIAKALPFVVGGAVMAVGAVVRRRTLRSGAIAAGPHQAQSGAPRRVGPQPNEELE